MKATHLSKLRVVTGIAALGLFGADVAHAQAPSGPITAAPSQAAPATAAKGSNSAPLPAPRTTILGAWKLNPDESDDPRKRREDSRGSNGGYGGGRGRLGRGGGGYGGRRGGGVSDEKDPRGNKMSRTYELSSDGRQLYETLHMTSGRGNTSLVIRYVYDIPIQTRQ